MPRPENGNTEAELFEGVAHAEKYQNPNWIARRLVGTFMKAIDDAVFALSPKDLLEVGCGEGHVLGVLAHRGYKMAGCDISDESLAVARREIDKRGLDIPLYNKSVYDLDPNEDMADTVLCCEVLEHLTDPELALEKLVSVTRRNLVLSVPNEPIWHLLNMARGKYLHALGNTPGHYNHWTSKAFAAFVSSKMDIVAMRTPLPWTLISCRPKAGK